MYVDVYIICSKIQKQTLIDSTLQSNEAYATKLTDSTQFFKKSIKLELTYSADAIECNWNDPNFLKQETFRVAKKTKYLMQWF